MSAVYLDELVGIGTETLQEEDSNYHEYLLKKAEEIPLKWKPYEGRFESESVRTFNFERFKPQIRLYVIAWAMDRLWMQGVDAQTIEVGLNSLAEMLEENPWVGINTNMEAVFQKYIEKLFESARQKVVGDEGDSLTIGTARRKAFDTIRFVLFCSSYDKVHKWSMTADILRLLPNKLHKYLNKAEIEAFRVKLFELENAKKTPSIPWATLYDLMTFLKKEPPSYVKTAIIIGVEAGLRISEIRQLYRDCLEPVSEAEKATMQRHLRRYADAAPIELDYSNSAWLKYHVIKGKGSEIVEGAPILVGKAVIEAINDLKAMTAELAERSGSDMLFLNEQSSGEISVRSYASLQGDRNTLVEKGMPYIRFHQLRATFATILHRLGVPIEMIEKYMNHVRSDVTTGYIDADLNENREVYARVLDNSIAGMQNNEAYQSMRDELVSVAEFPGFVSMSDGSRINFFKRLQRRYDVKIKIEDHGNCVLPADKSCPEGYDDVLPCHHNSCKSFHPDQNEKPFFIGALDGVLEKKVVFEAFAKEHGSLSVAPSRFNQSINSLNDIITLIEREGIDAKKKSSNRRGNS